MIRKLVLVLGATAVLGVTALAPTSASAWGWKHHHHHWHGVGIGLYPTVVATPDCYLVKVRPGKYVTVCN
jgi:hypothetical protein